MRVVSLVPSITEIIFKIGAGDAVKAITYHSNYPPETVKKEIIGGFFSTSLDKIEKIKPDMIFLSRFHKKVRERFGNGKCQLINIETKSISDSYENIILLGSIFNKEEAAAGIVNKIKDQLHTISRKVARIPESRRKRVIRLMGRDRVMTPGDDFFQNEMIRAAGGIPAKLGKRVPIDNAGGHSKMGELIARAVYEAVQEAVYRVAPFKAQNMSNNSFVTVEGVKIRGFLNLDSL